MAGFIIDHLRLKARSFFSSYPIKQWSTDTFLLDTDHGKVRIRDTSGNKPVIIFVPDGPNVIDIMKL